MSVGDQITVAGIHDGGVHKCLVAVIGRRYPDIFMVYPVLLGMVEHDPLTTAARWCGPHEEGVVWAHGWGTPAALALEALVALDRSR